MSSSQLTHQPLGKASAFICDDLGILFEYGPKNCSAAMTTNVKEEVVSFSCLIMMAPCRVDDLRVQKMGDEKSKTIVISCYLYFAKWHC